MLYSFLVLLSYITWKPHCAVRVWVVWTLTGGHGWTWEAWVTGCCHPSPVSRLGYSRLAKVRSQQLVPGGASISLTSQCASPLMDLSRWLFHVSYRPEPTIRPSESAEPSPRLAGCLNLHPLKVLPPRIKIVRHATAIFSADQFLQSISSHRTDRMCRSRSMPCRNQLWFPCATLRILINTLHCSVDAPS